MTHYLPVLLCEPILLIFLGQFFEFISSSVITYEHLPNDWINPIRATFLYTISKVTCI